MANALICISWVKKNSTTVLPCRDYHKLYSVVWKWVSRKKITMRRKKPFNDMAPFVIMEFPNVLES